MSNDPTLNSNLIASTRAQLDPLLQSVIDDLDADGNAYPMAFFSEILVRLRTIEEEADLLQLFIDLSTTAFQGFVLSEVQAASIDQLLARCEAIAFTMTAGGNVPH